MIGTTWAGRVVAVVAAAVVSVGGVIAISTGGPSQTSTGGNSITCTGSPLNNGADVATALAAAAAGSTICLNAGTYTYSAGAITKASTTTVTANNGVSRSSVLISNGPVKGGDTDNMHMGASSNLTFKNITIAGAAIGGSGGNASNILFQHIHWVGCVSINQASTGTMNVTLDGDVSDVSYFNPQHRPCDDDGRIQYVSLNGDPGYGGTSLVNATVKNMDFTESGCSDGIELRLGFNGATIGPGNTFHGYDQAACNPTAEHADPIQFYHGGDYSLITGNYWYQSGDTQHIQAPNDSHHVTITQNVFDDSDATGLPFQSIYCGWCEAIDFNHNTIVSYTPPSGSEVGQAKFFDWVVAGNTDHDPQHTSGTVNNNLFAGGGDADILISGDAPGNTATEDYNLNSAGSGAHDATGTVVFAGGSNPTTYAGFALSCPASAGCGTASDGTNRGINP